ncbi:hypothetical protein RIF29_15675 [Crotalaria pallida]|uniref:Uncharacterized protein n=1 Tax=Crotalaria pallida TaxID=3830 RepID=A0AAN9FFE8_CROPI
MSVIEDRLEAQITHKLEKKMVELVVSLQRTMEESIKKSIEEWFKNTNVEESSMNKEWFKNTNEEERNHTHSQGVRSFASVDNNMEELECTPGVRSFAQGDNSAEEPECTLGVRSFASANSHGGSGTFHIKAVRVQPDPKPLHNMLKLSMVGKRYVVMGASYETEIELVGESLSKMDDMWSLFMEDMLKESEWEAVIEVMLKRGNNFVLKSLFFQPSYCSTQTKQEASIANAFQRSLC